MKRVQVILFFLMAFAALAATPPAPPTNPTNPLLPPAGPVLLTNITLVYTNVAVKSPTLDFQNVTIYGGTNAFKGSTLVSWDASPDPDVSGYMLYYGPTTLAQTNKYPTLKQVTTVMLSGMLSTNLTYWFYVTATNVSGLESVPSNIILATGR